jgi:hypothetical protein
MALHRLDEVQRALGARLLFGDASAVDSEFSRVIVASSMLDTLLEYAADSPVASRPLVISHVSRVDVLLGLLAAHVSGAHERQARCMGLWFTV